MDIDIDKLKNSDAFCIAPWTHMNINPNGTITPCCLSSLRYGSLNQQSLEEIWNSDEIKKLRVDMLNGVIRPECLSCHKDGEIEHDPYRKELNDKFSDSFNYINETKEDGTFDRFNLVYWDFRLSNICNFKCRMCGPDLSSSWAKEIADHNLSKKNEILLSCDKPSFWQEIEPLYQIVEKIYFAGGEPLIMDYHYKILDKLIENEKFDVEIFYTTNFSNLKYKNNNILHYWKKFTNLIITISIDGFGTRGELIRKGFDWKKLIDNAKQFYSEFYDSDLKLQVFCTVQILNSLHVVDLHKKLYEEGIIRNLNDFKLILLKNPSHSSVTCLPIEVKEQIFTKVKNHIKYYLKPQQAEEAIFQFIAYMKYLVSKPIEKNLIKTFIDEIEYLDKIRDENTRKVFPEFEEIIWKQYLN
jgi:MoaA/NifB/PqqE/SkfB family radical SAM enzyme